MDLFCNGVDDCKWDFADGENQRLDGPFCAIAVWKHTKKAKIMVIGDDCFAGVFFPIQCSHLVVDEQHELFNNMSTSKCMHIP